MEDFKQHPAFLCLLDLREKYNLWIGLRHITASNHVHYELWYNDGCLFSGNDFKPSPLYMRDSLECILTCLSFLTLQLGGADKDYFKNYTPQQVAFRDSFETEQLNVEINDYDVWVNGHNPEPFYKEAFDYFTSHFKG